MYVFVFVLNNCCVSVRIILKAHSHAVPISCALVRITQTAREGASVGRRNLDPVRKSTNSSETAS